MYTYSIEHINYLKKLKRERILISILRISILFTFIIIWELLARFNLINTFLYSSPSRIINTIIGLLESKELIKHILITMYEVLISFGISTILGILIASILWFNKRLSKVLDPYITIINSLPKVALGPLIIVWVGSSTNSIIFMALLISLFTTIINIYIGFTSINEDYITMMKSFKATKLQIFRLVIFPSSIENIISTLKVNISLTLIGVIMGELLVSKAGLGYLIMYGSQVFKLDLVISSIFILGIISYLMYFLVDYISKIIKKKVN